MIERITEGMTGEEAANRIYDNDAFLQALMAQDYVSKAGFSAAMITELAGQQKTLDFGIHIDGTLSAGLGTQFLWTTPVSRNELIGNLTRVRVFLSVAGNIWVNIGQAEPTAGPFTVRKRLGPFAGVVGENIITIANEPIDKDEIVALNGDASASMTFGQVNTYGTKWVRQRADGFQDSGTGWIPYDYTVTGVTRSELYDVFETKAALAADYVSKAGFSAQLVTELAGKEVAQQIGVSATAASTNNTGSVLYHWTYPQSIAALDTNLTVLAVRLTVAGNVRFAIGSAQPTSGGFTLRKIIGTFAGIVGVNLFTLSTPEAIKKGEILALIGETGTAASISFQGGTQQNSRWIRQRTDGVQDSASGWWQMYGTGLGLQPSILTETFLTKLGFGAKMADYVKNGQEGVKATIGEMGTTAGTVTTPTTGYYGNPIPFASDGRIDDITLNLVAGATINFAVGNLDQFGIFLESAVFTRAFATGLQTQTLMNIPVKAGQVILIKNPPASLNYATGASYVYTNTPGVAVTTVANQHLLMTWLFTPIAAPVVASIERTVANENAIAALQIKKPGLVFSVPGNFEYKLICDDNGSNIRAASPYPTKGRAIGNSITVHGITSFWWGVWGMAATTRANDYVHKFEAMVKAKNPSFAMVASGNAGWESAHVGYNYANWDALLPLDTDLVTIVVGDNVSSLTGYANSCLQMLTYVRTRLPNAKIVVTDSWYYSADKAAAMQAAAAAVSNVTFVSIKAIHTSANEAGMGTIVQGDDGQSHAINNSGVGSHPGDPGHLGIAQTLFLAAF